MVAQFLHLERIKTKLLNCVQMYVSQLKSSRFKFWEFFFYFSIKYYIDFYTFSQTRNNS